MNLTFSWQRYGDATGKASDIGRQLGFVAIAILWALKGAGEPWGICSLLGALCVVLGMVCDTAQYLVQSWRWRKLSNTKELEFESAHGNLEGRKREKAWKRWKSKEWDVPEGFHHLPECLFLSKLLLVALAYVFVAIVAITALV